LRALNLKAAETKGIRAQIAAHRGELYYPNSVERFYKASDYKLAWIAPDTVKTHAWDAMLLLDCVVQYGLDHSYYHPGQLLYPKLHELIKQAGKANDEQAALYDIMLTDAVMAFINNLHYGRLNPEWPAYKIDTKVTTGFRAEVALANALNQKDFYSAIISVQPTSASYKALQYKMHLVSGLYTGDCYETPESVIRLMAVNLERMRWVSSPFNNSIIINIPSNILSYYTKDTVYRFKIQNSVSCNFPASFSEFTTRNNLVVLRQGNKLKIMPVEGKPLMGTAVIIVKDDGKLASLLRGHQLIVQKNKFYRFPAISVKTTYYTCEVLDAELVTYKDYYQLDKDIEKALYPNMPKPLISQKSK
jgi:hypothetical protein